jgi:hypothetical protein
MMWPDVHLPHFVPFTVDHVYFTAVKIQPSNLLHVIYACADHLGGQPLPHYVIRKRFTPPKRVMFNAIAALLQEMAGSSQHSAQ